jgi:restriction system protein
MPVPSMGDILLPVLRLLEGPAFNAKTCLPGLQQEFALTEAEMAELIPSGFRGRVFDRADWAIFHLMKAGLVDRTSRGVYATSPAGKALLQSGQAFGWPDLTAMPLYRSAIQKSVPESGTPDDGRLPTPQQAPAAVFVDDVTPDEAMRRAFQQLQGALEADLLDRLHSMHPIRFERLILDLLKAMGYGAGSFGKHEMTKTSGDGGIDGIIHEDALGLDAVYIQAKRYQAETKVGRPAIQQFIGSLTGEGATKGVFVTTSDFSAEARGYLAKVQHRVVLIGGRELARLMIRHGVGVRDRVSYVIRSVDEDYFADPEG